MEKVYISPKGTEKRPNNWNEAMHETLTSLGYELKEEKRQAPKEKDAKKDVAKTTKE